MKGEMAVATTWYGCRRLRLVGNGIWIVFGRICLLRLGGCGLLRALGGSIGHTVCGGTLKIRQPFHPRGERAPA